VIMPVTSAHCKPAEEYTTVEPAKCLNILEILMTFISPFDWTAEAPGEILHCENNNGDNIQSFYGKYNCRVCLVPSSSKVDTMQVIIETRITPSDATAYSSAYNTAQENPKDESYKRTEESIVTKMFYQTLCVQF
jgi:hypothetical protein